MSTTLANLAPSLRVIFAGLAKISYEYSRTIPPTLPKIGKNKAVKRPGHVNWTLVPGYIGFAEWRKFLDTLKLIGLGMREITQSFLSSIMCVVDGNSADGRIKDRYLPFEGFLEALVRIATVVPLPTDEQMARVEIKHAGAYLSYLLEMPNDNGLLDQMTEEQRCDWGGTPDPSVAGEMPRRIEHLVDVIVRRIKMPDDADEPLGFLTRRDFRQWVIGNMAVADSQIPEAWVKETQLGENQGGLELWKGAQKKLAGVRSLFKRDPDLPTLSAE